MTNVISNQSRPTELSLLNLSLGISFLLSSVFPIGKLFLSITGFSTALSALANHEAYVIASIAKYWVPTILLYIGFRVTRIDIRIKPSATTSTLVLIGNILCMLYLSVRIFASTIEGGGPSFLVASFSIFIIGPAILLYVIGFINLLKKISSTPKQEPENKSSEKLTKHDPIIIILLLLIPIAAFIKLPLGKVVAVKSSYSLACNTAEIKIIEKVSRAKSAALMPDSFTVVARDRKSETGPWSHFILNQSLLEYIELPKPENSELVSSLPLVKMTTTGDRILRSTYGSDQQTQYNFEPISEISAEYIISEKIIPVEHGKELGIGGSRIEIHRRSDNKLIAYAQYFWSNKEFKACPAEAHNGLFVFKFIAEALNVKSPKANF